MVNNLIQNITGKTSIIEGHENDCHSTADGNNDLCISLQIKQVVTLNFNILVMHTKQLLEKIELKF